MNRNYSVIVFDLGNVLIPFDYSIAVDKLNKIESGLGDNFIKLYKDNYHLHRAFERGDMSEHEFIDSMLKLVDYKIDAETFCEYYSKIFAVNEDVAALLPVLKQKYTVVLLSNSNSIHQKYGYRHYEFFKHFDKLFLSHEVNAVKPEEKIYRTVEAYTKKPSDEHIFIDDVEEYTTGAKKIG
ncbi:MAG: HAD hydrolase-like protein, partial [Ignavibacteriaceae bacterium]|nr:HAD hydrolase-like protein [Ignavibacteriaceae bacterium]